MNYNGTAASDVFNVSATGQVTLNSRIPVLTTGISTLQLLGLDGDDTFNVIGGVGQSSQHHARWRQSVGQRRGQPERRRPGAVAVNYGVVSGTAIVTTVTGYGSTVTLTGDEILNANANANPLTVNGTNGDDALQRYSHRFGGGDGRSY